MLENFRSQKIIWDRANKTIFEKIEANSGDSNGRNLSVQVLDEGKIVDLTGVVLSLAWRTNDKKNYGLDAFRPVDATKGIFEIFYTTEMLSNTGMLRASLVLVDGTGRVESDRFSITVKDSVVNDSSVQSANSFTALTEALISVTDLEKNYAPRLNEVTAQVAQNELDKISHGNVSVNDINKNLGKFDQTYMSDEFIAQFVDNTQPINSIPATHSITNAQLAKKSVSYNKLSFIEKSTNLVNALLTTKGFTLSSTDGSLVASQYYSVTDFIEIEGGSVYSKSVADAPIYFYDNNRQYISRQASVSNKINTPINAVYMRTRELSERIYDLQINEGEALLPFQPYKISISQKEKLEINNNSSTSFFEKSSNVFNKLNVLDGVSMDENGNQIEVSTRVLSDFIKVNGNAVYSKSEHAFRVAYYDKLNRFIIRVSVNDYDETFTTHTGADSMRVSPYSEDIDNLMINEGYELLPYEEYYYYLTSTNEMPIRISETILKTESSVSGSTKQPFPPKLEAIISSADSRYVGWMSDDGEVLYGMLSQSVRQSIDGGITWKAIYTLPTDNHVSFIRQLKDGELLVGVRTIGSASIENAYVIKSTGYDRSNPTFATWSRVLDLNAGGLWVDNGFCVSIYNNLVVLCEYGEKPNASSVYLSKNYGNVFERIYNLNDYKVDDNAHMHGVCYDPWFDRIYISHGDGDNSAVKYSDDLGLTWDVVSTQSQVTSMFAMASGIIMATDSSENAVLRLPRTTKQEQPKIVEAYKVENDDHQVIVGQLIYQKPGVGNPVFISFGRKYEGRGIIISTIDGINFYEVFKDWESYDVSKGVLSLVGPTKEGKVIGTISDDRQSSYSKIIANEQEWKFPY